MLDNSVVFGLGALSGGMTAFINCTMESLTESHVDVLPASMTYSRFWRPWSQRPNWCVRAEG